MAKSFKRFLPLFLVVISGVIFLGDISQKILPLDQAQATEKEEYVPRKTKVITINSGTSGRYLSEPKVKISRNGKVMWYCNESLGDAGYGSNSQSEGKSPGHEIKLINEDTGRLFAKFKVPYNSSSEAIPFPDSGTYEYTIDNDPALRGSIDVIDPIYRTPI